MDQQQQQEGGWPLGLQPVNVRVGLARNPPDFSGSVSFNTLLTASPSSCSDSSSDLDTESTGSFFHDKSITLGSLIGVSSILELSGRSFRGRGGGGAAEPTCNKKGYRRTWLFSLCSRNSVDTENVIVPSSLGHFLAVERRASREDESSLGELFVDAHPVIEPNSLFVNGRLVPPRTSSSSPWDRHQDDDDDGGPVLFSCMCAQPTC